MPDRITALLDPGALAIVLVGALLATAARCGWRDFVAALRLAARLMRRGFDAEANRRALALAHAAITRDGAYRADPAPPPDRALALMLDAFLRHRTPAALDDARHAAQAHAAERHEAAARVFACAGDLAPVFGLVGTLYGLTQLAPGGATDAGLAIGSAVSMAVLTTLYGALLAHFVCFPLAGAITRRAAGEARARAALADWFTAQLVRSISVAPDRRAHLRGVA